MRSKIVREGAGELRYVIREIVEHANRIQSLGVDMAWENIGDPVHKGEQLPDWIKDIVAELAHDNSSYAYSATKGILKTREFLAQRTNSRGGVQINAEDIIFYNGLGDAVAKVYGQLAPTARVIVPTPVYTTHSSGEGGHAGTKTLTYELDPARGWEPDLDALRKSVADNPAIAGILVINPGNPTGTVHSKETLEGIVAIAREFDLFLIFDEIYINLVYGGAPSVRLGDIIGDVCGISMQGISKEVPWPGSRCGWLEIYNQKKDPAFVRYATSLFEAKMLEVCSTTLPQKAIPLIMSDPRYKEHVQRRCAIFASRAKEIASKLSSITGVTVNEPRGAFYLTGVFDPGLLDNTMTLPLPSKEVRQVIEDLVKPNPPADHRFIYYLLGSTGIVAVPLTSFDCKRQGFRVTLLEGDDIRRQNTFDRLANAIPQYIASSTLKH
ncbi:MAG: aminotransferase [Deltaproteobacteria bacterium RIFOXYA12_FULL_58_15]|nr:MAG: aminotransferase [Deltaproteobacteria bacterium RIFOXYA12_FULL_58_15]OGR14305.1 MAG: aminotransferase [Deltaproteobacteria bacterium RIFOXYB12_FULL_58_9]